MQKKEKQYFKFLNDGVVQSYEFVPEYNRWIDMKKQKEIVKKLENVTNTEKNNENLR